MGAQPEGISMRARPGHNHLSSLSRRELHRRRRRRRLSGLPGGWLAIAVITFEAAFALATWADRLL